jgi:predicted CXXCH cytochrome family protein
MQGWIRSAALMSIALATIAPPAAASVMNVITPPAFSAIDGDHISVVGTSTSSTVTLTLPGRIPETTQVTDGWFHFRANLKYGFNELYLSSSGGDSVWLAAVRLPFQVNIRRSKVRYPRFKFHGNEIGETCIKCHALTPFTQAARALPDSTCQSCHLPIREWIKPHRPAAESECRVCHGTGVLPIAAPADNFNLCQSCHKGKIEEFNKEFVHGPVGAGSCLACHDPHGSDVQFSLRKPVQLLCSSCHEEIEAKSAGKLLHAPFRDGACNACHDPHATNYAWGLSRRSNSICLPCHRMDDDNGWHSHPTTGPLHSNDQTVALNAEGELECTSCHNPHYAESTHLLRTSDPNTCRGCHDDK